jgi:hypothetical protein
MRAWRQPRSAFHWRRRASGEVAMNTRLARWFTVGGVAVPAIDQVGAHRAGPSPLRAVHGGVGDQRGLVAEQAGEVAGAVLALEAVAIGDRARPAAGAALRGDGLDMAAQLDLFGQQRVRAARYSGLSPGMRMGPSAGEVLGGSQGVGDRVHGEILRSR